MADTDEIEDSRRPVLRSLWFQFHKWIGISLAIVLIPLSLTGSALVWRDQIDHVANAQRYAVTGPAKLPVTAYLDAADKVLPEDADIVSLTVARDGPVEVTATDPSAPAGRRGAPMRIAAWLDPATGRVLDVGPVMGGAMRLIHNFHGSLMYPGMGRTVVGWFGVAMLISAITGLWLWWPSVGGIARGLQWRRQRHGEANLHHQIGFWTSLPLALLSLTGVLIAFPALLGGGPGGYGQGGGAGMMGRMAPLAETNLGVEQALAAARALAKGQVRSIAWPTERQPAWRISLGGKGQEPVTVTVDDGSGEPALSQPERRRSGAIGLNRSFHDGEGLSVVWQAIIFLAGLMPTILGITGIWMWLRMRRIRRRAASREAVETTA